MADERQPIGQPYELFGQIMFQGRDEFSEVAPDYEPTEGQVAARESVPIVKQTDKERLQQKLDLEESTPGIGRGIDLATQQEWIPRLWSGNRSFTPDPDFEWTEDYLLELTKGLPEDAHSYVAKAQSKREAEFLARRYREDYAREEELSKMGYAGVGLRVGAALTDPAAWGIGAAATALTGPAGLVGVAANRLNRAARIALAGTAGAAGNLAVEAAIGANKPIYDSMNYLYAAGLGFGLGGGLAAISRNPSTRVEADGLVQAGEGLQREAEEYVREIFQSATYTPVGDDAGAMRVSREIPLKEGDESIESFLENVEKDPNIAPKAAFGKVRLSSMAMGLSSKNPAVRAIFSPLAEEGVGHTNRNSTVPISASERQRLREQQVTTEWMRGYRPNFREWMKSQDASKRWKPFNSEEMAKVFNRQVTDYVEGLLEDAHPAVARQGEVMRKILDDYRKDLNQPMGYRQEFGKPVNLFGTLEKNPFYVPHEFDLVRMRQLVDEFGTYNLETLIARAITDATEGITDEAARRAGQAYLKTIRSLDAGIGMDTARILASGDAEEMKAFLRNNADGDVLSDADIEDIVDALTVRKQNVEGGPKYGKSRTPLNMDTKLVLRRNPVTRPEGGSREVSIRELFNRDAHDLLARYNRRMSGALAMARYRIPGLSEGISSHGEWQTLMDKAREIGYRQGIDPKVTNRELKEADLMYRAIMGIPNQADLTRWGEALKFFRDWSFMRFMGQVGFAQIPELGVAASGLGLKAMFKGMPAFRGLTRSAQDGKISHELVDELEVATGLGGDWLRAQQLNRFNDMTGTQDTFLGQSQWKDRLEMSTKKGKNVVFAGSGMATINTFMKRATMNGIAQKFALHALGEGKGIPKARLRTLGLNDAQVDRILENIRKHAQFDEGLAGKKVRKMNLHRWDLAAEADFTEALFRYTNRLVQENDIGQFRMWMSHPVARMFLQFRSFIIGAHEKQLLHNLHMRDFQSFTTFASTTFFAGLGYTAMTYARSVGRSDQEEYLRKRLSPTEIAKASFERASWAALLPTAIDTIAPGTFTYRSTGQATGAIFGNPTADTIESAHTFLETLLSGDALDSQEDVKNMLRLLPFQNLNGVVQISNLLLGESGLPENAPKDY